MARWQGKHISRAGVLQDPNEPPLMEKRPDGRHGFAKGHKKHGGRKKGTPNQVTEQTRKLMADFVLYGMERVKKDYAYMRRKDRARAVESLLRASEYVLPKLARTEQTGPGGGPIVVELVTLEGAPPTPPAQEAGVDAPAAGEE